ncbi:hypothetical protein [Olleya sp. AS48]|uniref:hypothetical protein n=1 Tax=Olleya sp. AS48 TaxID=3135774 RepID=UPI0030DC1F8B|tara:strand:- start:1323 stop:2039 length:717 start_codon:yes stop_codon:yes gene_type:complete
MGKQKTKLEIKAELAKEFDVHVSAYGGYANDESEKPIVDIIEKVAANTKLKPSYLFTIAVGEGLGLLYLDLATNYKNNKLVTDKQINGFQVLGLDFFSSPKEYPRFKKYLPNDYNIHDEYEPYMAERNERYGKEIVPSAKFKDLESAIEGIGAVLAHRRDLFHINYKKFGYKNPTEDEEAYWSYYFYQAEGDAKRLLEDNGGLDIFFLKSTSRSTIHVKALERVASWRYLLHYNIFTS